VAISGNAILISKHSTQISTSVSGCSNAVGKLVACTRNALLGLRQMSNGRYTFGINLANYFPAHFRTPAETLQNETPPFFS
jgi:hypothetical protein